MIIYFWNNDLAHSNSFRSLDMTAWYPGKSETDWNQIS